MSASLEHDAEALVREKTEKSLSSGAAVNADVFTNTQTTRKETRCQSDAVKTGPYQR